MTANLPFKFTSKELDTETGLYYYGFRYRDPRSNVWYSADPILASYLPTGNKDKDKNLPGMGGVFNTVNVNLYHYAGNNPVRFIDPDGNAYLSKDSAGYYSYTATNKYLATAAELTSAIPFLGTKIAKDWIPGMGGMIDLKYEGFNAGDFALDALGGLKSPIKEAMGKIGNAKSGVSVIGQMTEKKQYQVEAFIETNNLMGKSKDKEMMEYKAKRMERYVSDMMDEGKIGIDVDKSGEITGMKADFKTIEDLKITGNNVENFYYEFKEKKK